jgi:glyoxylase-like metal-dependent hydrolase (beta-lactamase superfamily II)
MATPSQLDLGRRSFLGGVMAAAGTLAAGRGIVHSAPEGAPTLEIARNPLVYHFKIGELDAWSVSDGQGTFRDPLNLMHPEEDRPAMKEWLVQHGERLDGIALYINILVVRIGKEIVVFDAGFGEHPNPNFGWMAEGLRKIGIAPEQVTAAFLSHSHIDHLAGFVKGGKPMFPNAAFHFLPEEKAFWHEKEPDFSKSKRNKAELPGLIHSVREQFAILQDVSRPLKPGDSLFGGAVTIESAPGHTSGHAIFRIRSGNESLLHLMDLSHHHGFMYHNPNWTIAFDHDPVQSIDTRKKVFAKAAAERTRCYGFHVPWPGLGQIIPAGEGYLWHSERWDWGV